MPTLAELALGADVGGAIGRGLDLRRTVGALQDSDRARRSSQALDQAFAGGVPTDPAQRQSIEQQVFRTGGAAAGLQVRDLFQQMSAAEREQAAQEGRIVATFLAGVQDQGTYDRARAGLQARGIDISSLPEQFNPAHRDFIVNSARDLEDILKSQQPGEGFTLGAGQTRFDAQGRPVASVPADTSSGGFTLTPGQARFDRLGREIASRPAAAAGPDATVANQLRDEFVKQTDEFADVQNAFRKVEAAAQTDSGPGDLALLVGYMKIIDPGSVVRETEFATAEQAPGIEQQTINLFNRIRTGERLTPEARQQFVRAANDQFQTYTAGYNQTVQTYEGLAGRFGLDPATVVINRAIGSAAAGRDISGMTLDELGALDPATLSDAELLAAQERVQELSGAR